MAEYRNGKLIEDASLTNTGGAATLGALLGDVANSSIAARLGILQNHMGPSYNDGRYLSVTADMTNVIWNKWAAPGPTHEVFNVTGMVRMRMWIECTGNVDSALDGATICFGHSGDTAAFIAATDEDTLDTGELWYAAAPATAVGTFATVVMDYVVNGLDVGYEITAEPLTAGSLVFHCVWEPLNAIGNVTAGAGGAL